MYKLNCKNKADGLDLLASLPDAGVPLVIADFQYRGVLDYLAYGNEGARQIGRASLPQMSDDVISQFIREIARVTAPSGHVMLWLDKTELLTIKARVEGFNVGLKTVDFLTWNKGRIGMGYRTRRKCEYLYIAQKLPTRVKGVWTRHDIPDVWEEKQDATAHAHAKPLGLQTALIEATTRPGDLVVDPCAGSYSVMHAARSIGRNFLGCDLVYGGSADDDREGN